MMPSLTPATRREVRVGTPSKPSWSGPPARPDRLAGFANALLSPHIAERTARMVAEDVIRALRGEVPIRVAR
jgi:hypothetical protein